MASSHIYYPRALRHFTDYSNHLKNFLHKEVIEGFILTEYKVSGSSIEMVLESKDNKIFATYYRFGFLKLHSEVEINDILLNLITERLWSFAFKNSVISVTTFKSGISGAGNYISDNNDYKTDILGFCNSVVQILDGIGDHNRELFKNLESAYHKSPYKDFLKLVQSDRFSSLSIFISRLNQIDEHILEFKSIYKEGLDTNSLGRIENVQSETRYLIRLVNLTRSYFEKRYTGSLHVRESRRTRLAIIISILACLAAIYVVFADALKTTSSFQSMPKSIKENNKELNINLKENDHNYYLVDSLNISTISITQDSIKNDTLN